MPNEDLTTAIDAFRVTMEHARDVSGLIKFVKEGRLGADEVVAVTGKTAGWGAGYGPSRVEGAQAVRKFLLEYGTRSADQIDEIPMAFSAGVGTVLTPHLVLYTRTLVKPALDGAPRLALGSARSDIIQPEWIGTTRTVQANADAVRAAAADGEIDPSQIEFVVGKAYYPTQETMAIARAAGRAVPNIDERSMFNLGSGSAALGVGVAVDGWPMPSKDDIGRNLALWSDRLAVSTNGWEPVGGTGPQTQLVVFGNRQGAGGRLRVGHSAFADLLDVASVPRALRQAGVDVGDGPLTPEQSAKVAAVYMKFDEPVGGRLRGRRQVVEDPSYAAQLKTVVASAFSAMLQDNLIWISAGGLQQGPPGGGTLAIIVDVN